MPLNSHKLNLYSDKIPQKKLKEFIESGIDIYAWCAQLKNPVLITDIYEVFPNLKKWTPDFLEKKIGEVTVRVNTSETNVFVDYEGPLEMSLKDYSKQINSDNPNAGRKMYLSALGIDQSLPDLNSEIYFDSLLPQEKLAFQWLWYGPKGNTTGLHYDSNDNFFMQMYGQKRWLMSEPNSTLNLHPRSSLSKRPAISEFNPLIPDFAKYPKSQRVKFYDLTMNPGTVLYIPAFWWHQVESCSTVISVNIWCKTSMIKINWGFAHLLPLFIKSLPSITKNILVNRGR
jgi:hypothetical protein